MVKVHSGKFTKRCLRFIFALVVFAFLSVVVATGPNFIAPQDFFTSDPAAHVINGKVYLYTTHDPITATKLKNSYDYSYMYDYHCLTTTNFVDWVDSGSIVNSDDIPNQETYSVCHGAAWDGDYGIYANGKYYAYFPIGDEIRVAVSDTPDGHYSDARGTSLITRSTPNMPPYDSWHLLVSPCVYNDNGTYYIFWGQGTLYCARLKSNMIELDENPRVINTTGCNIWEDVWITKINNTYYFTYAKNGTCDIAYATSSSLLGPYSERGILLHGGVYNIQSTLINYNSNWYVFYHMALNGDGQTRRTAVAQVNVNADGTLQQIDISSDPGVGGPGAKTLTLDAFASKRQADEYRSANSASVVNDYGIHWSVACNNGGWIEFPNVDFGSGPSYSVVRLASNNTGMSGAQLQFRLDSPTGTVIATHNVLNTGGTTNFVDLSTGISNATGKHDLYLTFSCTSGSGILYYLDWFTFNNNGAIPTPTPSATIVNDNTTGSGNNQFNYNGSWAYSNDSHCYNGDNHYNATTNNYYTVAFNGTQVQVYGCLGSNNGIGAISIDGGAETNVDYYAASIQNYGLLYTSPTLTAGQHTLKVRVTGTKNASSTNYYVNADRVDISSGSTPTPTPTPTPGVTIVNDNTTGSGNNQFNYNGSWAYSNDSHCYNGDNHFNATTNNYYTVTFNGTQVQVYGCLRIE